MSEIKKDFLIPDLHVPHHDEQVLACYLDVLSSYRWDNVVFVGDFMDFATVSRHPRTRGLVITAVADDLEVGKEVLAKIATTARRKNPKAKIFLLGGNHDARLENYIYQHASALESFLGNRLSYDALLDLPTFNISYVPYMDYVRLGDVYLTHDVGRRAGKTAHQAAVDKLNVCVIHGHTHKLGVAFKGTRGQGTVFGAAIGWGGGPNAVLGYQDRLSAEIDNVHGFGVLYRSGSRSTIVPVPVFDDGTCLFADRLHGLGSRR